ncbi:unnamed protein product [Sphagnum balticum]
MESCNCVDPQWPADDLLMRAVHLRLLHRARVFLDSAGARLLREEVVGFPVQMGIGAVRCVPRAVRCHPFDQSMDLQCTNASCGCGADSSEDLHCCGFVCHVAHAGTYQS